MTVVNTRMIADANQQSKTTGADTARDKSRDCDQQNFNERIDRKSEI